MKQKKQKNGFARACAQPATTIPGALPTRINYVKVAESHRPMSDIIEGGSKENYISARTAFQVVYPSGSVMIDSGMDQTVHKFFGFGREEPFWPERNATVQQALKRSNLIVVTHEHGDHVAGVIRSDARKEIAAKTMLTREQGADADPLSADAGDPFDAGAGARLHRRRL